MKNQTDTIIYSSHYRYKIQFALALLLALALAWSLSQNFAPDIAFFFLTCIGILLWSARDAASSVEQGGTTITLKRSLGRAKSIALGHISDVWQEGRLGQSITLLYHPQQEDGLLDLDNVESLILPQVQRQDELYEFLKDRVIA